MRSREEIHLDETSDGVFFFNDFIFGGFGNKNLTFDHLKTKYSKAQPLELNQIHSDLCVKASSVLVSADAHWSDHKNQLLTIKTADCMPILVYSTEVPLILAIHAGWKGLSQNIISKSLSRAFKSKCSTGSLRFLIGPHIEMDSFEVQKPVAKELLKSLSPNELYSGLYAYQNQHGNFQVSLIQLVYSELKSLGLQLSSQVLDLSEDTKTNENFFSYRRDPRSEGRNLSFIGIESLP